MIVGHNNYNRINQPFVYKDKVFGLDTDCVHGKPLTELLLPAFRIVSVPSRGNHWSQIRRTYQKPPVVIHESVMTWSAQDDMALMQLIEKIREANLMQLERLNKLDLETGKKILKDPGEVQKLLITKKID